MRTIISLIFVLTTSLMISSHVFAIDTVHMVTMGKEAPPDQGDNDFTQAVYFKIPATITQRLYLRIFDPDCGGGVDENFGPWDTKTKFSFFGQADSLVKDDLQDTKPIAVKTFGIDSFTDNKWYTFAEFMPEKGEKVKDFYYFKLLVQGMSGNDGNVFNGTISLDPKQNRSPENLTIYNYMPTVNLPRIAKRFAELRFFIPSGTSELKIRNFDLENSILWFETPFESNFPLKASGQGDWQEDVVNIGVERSGQWGAVILQSFSARLNNAVIQILGKDDKPLPIEMPVYFHRANARPVPQSYIEFTSDCLAVVFDASRSMDPDHHFLEYLWDFGDGQTGKGARIIHRYEKADNYNCELVVIDDSGRIANRSRKKFSVEMNQQPIAEAGPDIVGAPGIKLAFDGSKSHDPDGKIVHYTWDFDDGSRAIGVTTNHDFDRPGRYNIRLRVKDDSQSLCNVATDSAAVWINAQPVVEIGPDRIGSPGESIAFDGNNCYDSDGEITHFLWDFGDGSQEEGRIVEHVFVDPGKYTVQLTVKDNTNVFNNSKSDKLTIKINKRPVAKAFVNKKAVAVDVPLHFSGASSFDHDDKIIEYLWQFGDEGKASGSQVDHAYKKPGVYTVLLTVRDDSGTSSDTAENSLTIVVNDPPVAHAGPNQMVTDSAVTFDSSESIDPDGTITARIWDFGDGSAGNGEKPVYIYKNPGTYLVTLTVTDDSGTSSAKDSATMTVVVNEKPIADAGMNQVAMPGESVEFDGSGSFDPDGEIKKYSWNFGDQTQGTDGVQATHAFEKPGIYTVRLKVFDNSGHKKGVGFDETRVIVNAQPVVRAGSDVFTAPNTDVVFKSDGSHDPDGKISSYEWSFSDGLFPAKTSRITRSFQNSGIYTATLRVTDDSGAANSHAQESITVHVNHRPSAKTSVKRISTCDSTIVFDASASADPDGDSLQYTWNFGDGTYEQSGPVVIHTYEKGGKYPVVLTVNDGSGLINAVSTASIHVNINRRPVADAGKDRTVCAGEIVLFDAGASSDPDGGALRYLWDFGEGSKVEGLNPAKIFKNGGIYNVTLTVEDSSGLTCNTDIDQMILQVAEAPVAEAGPDQTVCANTLVKFDGSGSRDFDGLVNAFSWDFGDGTSGGGRNPTHVYEMPGIYRTTLTITGDRIGNCNNTNSDEMTISVYAAPLASFTGPSMVPAGDSAIFDSSMSSASKHNAAPTGDASSVEAVKIISKTWDFGDGTTGEGDNVSHVYEKHGNYFVTLTVTTDSKNECNNSSVKKPVTVNASPVAEAGEDMEASLFYPVVFDGSGSKDPDGAITRYFWDFGDGNTGEGIQARHSYESFGKYTVKLTVTDNTNVANNKEFDTLAVRVNDPPKPVIQLEKEVFCPEKEIWFDGQKSHDNDGTIVSWKWDFGDGITEEGENATESNRISHVYAKPGIYSATLTVDDGSPVSNRIGMIKKKIIVNQVPIPDAGPDRIVCTGEKVTFNASMSNDHDGKSFEYLWSFGDELEAQGRNVVHKFDKPGTYEVRLKIVDNSGSNCSMGEDTAVIFVNSPPVANAGPDREVFTGGAHDAVLFDGTKSFDPDKSALTYTWDFGDSTTQTGPVVFHYFAKPGRYRVKLRVDDSSKTSCRNGWDEAVIVVKKRQ